jgi:glycolate oxidase FAD binding subunit
LRHRFGTPRDLLIGITLALTDGRLVKAGGTVVKNVAGYDLGKLVSGSCGSLAAIVDATFKLLPLPQASATLVASYTDAGALARDVAAIQASQVELTAFDVRADDGAAPQLLMRVASSPAATATQVEAVTQLLSTSPQVLSGAPEQEIWAEQIASAWQGSGTVVRFSWLPASLPAVLSLVARAARPGCRPSVFAGRIVGSGLLRLDGEEAACAAAIQELRASADVGHVVVLRASRSLKSQIDVWGPPSSAISMARALTRMFDPMGILNAGRGPV